MRTSAVIIGAGGHGREVLDILRACSSSLDIEFMGFLDDGVPVQDRLARLGAGHLGGIEELTRLPGAVHYVGIGDPAIRRRLADRALELGSHTGPPLVHPRAHVGTDVEIGDGSVLFPGSVVTTNVRLGQHVHLSPNVTVSHDAVLEDFVLAYPGASILGDALVGHGTVVGANAVVGKGAVVPPGSLVAGIASPSASRRL